MWNAVTGVGTDRLGHGQGYVIRSVGDNKSGALGQGSTWHNAEGLDCMSAHCSKGDTPGPELRVPACYPEDATLPDPGLFCPFRPRALPVRPLGKSVV